MFPLSDESRHLHSRPVVTIALIAANILVFAFELSQPENFVVAWSVVPSDIVSGQHWVTLLTAMFIHGGFMHIIGNMVFLWVFGPEMEDAMGPAKYLSFYLAGGLVAWAAQIAADPASMTPNIGASGAIAAVMGAFLVTFPRDRIRTVLILGIFFRVTRIPAAILIGFWFLLQLISAGVSSEQAGGVAYVAHIGGLVFGAVTGRLLMWWNAADLSSE